MMRRDELKLLCHFVLKPFDSLGKEFDNPPALSADHVIVMVVVVVVLKIGLVVAKPDLPGQTGLRKQSKGPVNSRVSNRWIFFMNEAMKVVKCQVFLGTEKGMHYQLALASPTKPGAFYMLQENLSLRFE